MRLLLVIVLVRLLAGCSHASIDVNSTTSGGHVGVHVHSSSLAAVVIAGMFVAAAVDDARQDRPFPSFSTFSDWFRGTPPPALAEDRKVSEQDCSRPIDPSAGNLRCR